MIEQVTLGHSTIQVSPLGIGTWAWGDRFYWSYGQDYGEAELQATFAAAIEAGVTLFDTAEVYGLGESERLLGRFLQHSPAAPAVHIATKYFPFPWRWRSEDVEAALDHSLDRLQLKSVSLYQVHWPLEFLLSQRKVLETLARAVQAGKIQAVGVSNYSAAQLRNAHSLLAEWGIPLAVNQVLYSLLARQIENNGVLDTARALGVTILAYSPLAQGLLTGKYATAQPAPLGIRKLDPRFSASGLQKIQPLLHTLDELAQKYDRSVAQVALNWLIAQGVIPIPGAKTPAQAQQNAGAMTWKLAPEDVAVLSQV